MSESQIQKMRALILKHAGKIASGFPSDEFAELIPRATDEELLRGCMKLIVSFGLWMKDFLDGQSVVLLSTGKPSQKDSELSENLKNLLDEYGRLALDNLEQMTLRQEISRRQQDARVLALNLIDLKMCIASVRLIKQELGSDVLDESVHPKDYEYLIHPQAGPMVELMLLVD